MKVKEIIKLIEKDGWFCSRTKGSHQQYKHLTKTEWLRFQGTQTRIFIRKPKIVF